MAATVLINRLTGSGPTQTDVTSTTSRASTSDNPSPGTNNPIPVPSSGTNYSYWVSYQLNCTVAPATLIDNIRFYTDGNNGYGTGISLNGQSANSYVEATGTPGQSGDELSTGNHAGLTAAPVSVFTFTSGSPKSLTGDTSTTGLFGQLMVVQFAVGTTATPGPKTSETLSFTYDET